ncbi:hypothetical protein GCM10010492_24850 [Saccharothrix mutabilis subsp. mutabilis]|uniref:Uncharacterized protein n=1 Tax=Saccharothrix mutabilis subsp. mutabilis TaxID=66855 RepID=A0ABN0TMT2_9PSEU
MRLLDVKNRIAVGAFGALVVLAAWLLLSPRTVDVAVIDSISADGTVVWRDAELRPAESNNTDVRALDGAEHRHTSRLAADAEFYLPLGCGSSRGVQVALFSGVGTVECTREQFAGAAVHAPRLTFNSAGEITEIAGRYHP